MTEIQVLYKHLEEFHLEELIDCSYYYGQLDEDNAKSLLEDENFGTYLIRDGPLKTDIPLILSIKTTSVFHCSIRTDKMKHSLKIEFNERNDMGSKRLPGLPLSVGPFEDFYPPNNSIVGEMLSTIYRLNQSLSNPLRRNVVLSLRDMTRKKIVALVKTKDVDILPIPGQLKTFIKKWRTTDPLQLWFSEKDFF